MDFTYRIASSDDIKHLADTRIQVLRAANKLDDTVDLSYVKDRTLAYYRDALDTGDHTACLVFDKDTFIGAGGVSYYSVMPTYHNPTGRKAYIMNLYTDPSYRRKGIAANVLDMLVRDAKGKGVTLITLEATEMGRPLYVRYGFLPMENEMYLPEK